MDIDKQKSAQGGDLDMVPQRQKVASGEEQAVMGVQEADRTPTTTNEDNSSLPSTA